jgi:hypothetical protein
MILHLVGTGRQPSVRLRRARPVALYQTTVCNMWRHLRPCIRYLDFSVGYAILMTFNPVRSALGDGFRCIRRYKRIWISFALLRFGYFLFQFVTFLRSETGPT